MLILWQIGNTTVRTPYRLKEALQALKTSEFHGNLLGKECEQGFAELLDEKSIVRLDRKESGKDARKFKIDQDFLPLSHAPEWKKKISAEIKRFILKWK